MVVDYTDGGMGGKSGGWIDAVNGRKFWLFGSDAGLVYNDRAREQVPLNEIEPLD